MRTILFTLLFTGLIAFPFTEAAAWTIIPARSEEKPQTSVRSISVKAPTAQKPSYIRRLAVATPSTPILISPLSDETYTAYPRVVTVSWQNDALPQHTIEITCDYCTSATPWGGTPLIYTSTGFTNTYSGIILPGDNEYRVRVKSVNSSGVESAWSDYRFFRFRT